MRNIDRNLHKDQWFRSLSEHLRLAWVCLITQLADDQGRFIVDPIEMRYVLFSGDPNITDEDLFGVVATFSQKGKLQLYTVEDVQYGQIVNWWRYQNQSSYMAASKYPAPDGWTDRFHYTGKNRKHIKSDNWNEGVAGFITLNQVFSEQK